MLEGLRERSQSSPDIDAMIKVIEAMFDFTKDRLVDATGDELLRLQGEARAFKNLARMIGRPVVIPKTKEQ